MESSEGEKPPVFRRWSSWYWLVLLAALAQIILYSIITFSFA